jgi:hypothetical protein
MNHYNVGVWTGGSLGKLVWNVGDEAYPQRDYDMKITFTKKVSPEVGGTAKLGNYPAFLKIIAINDDRVWLQDPVNESTNFVRRFDQLVDAQPWQPV